MVSSLLNVRSYVVGCMLFILLVIRSPVTVLVCCLHTQVTGRTSVYTFINTCYYIHACNIIIRNYTFHVSIVTSCVCSKCMYILLQLYEDMLVFLTCIIYISTLNALANLFWHIPVCGSYVAGLVVITQHAHHLQ